MDRHLNDARADRTAILWLAKDLTPRDMSYDFEPTSAGDGVRFRPAAQLTPDAVAAFVEHVHVRVLH